MKAGIILLMLFFYVSLPVISQDSIQESNNIQSRVVLNKNVNSFNSLTIHQSDTVYYNDGKIKTISIYPLIKNKIGNNLISGFETQKKVLQYDKCGNLRNTTEIGRYTGQIDSCHDYYFNNKYQIRDNIIENIDCDFLWIKPILIF